jgi:peptidoglycan/xylan/chitin deacetylase (PgdA/CDA1 family)
MHAARHSNCRGRTDRAVKCASVALTAMLLVAVAACGSAVVPPSAATPRAPASLQAAASVLPSPAPATGSGVGGPVPGATGLASPNGAASGGVASPSPSPVPVPTRLPASPAPTRSYPPTQLAAVGRAAPLVSSGSRAYPVVALTIDDCWSPSAVLAILAILQAEHVNATFFPIGQAVEAYPWVWRTVGAAGYPVANHTWDHMDLTRATYEHDVWDIRHDNEVVGAIVGRPLLPFVRPPGGAVDEMVLQAAAAAGERAVVTWDTTLGDTGRGSVAELIANGVRGTNGSIVLMHANHDLTQLALPAVIANYRARGFSFVTLGQLFGVPGPVPFAPAVAPTAAPSPTPAARPAETRVPDASMPPTTPPDGPSAPPTPLTSPST